MYMKNTALGDMSQDKYSTQLRLMLYLFLNTPPHVVLFIQTCGSALRNIYSYIAMDLGVCLCIYIITSFN